MAQRQSYLSQPQIQRLPNLLREVQAGEIRVPRFQRPFVWKTDQRLDLFKSIYEGIPVGSFLIWRTRDHDLQCYDHLGSVRQYLLDGHQRLTTLYVALGEGLIGGGPIREDLVQDRDGEAQIEGDWPIFFNLDEKTFEPHPRHGSRCRSCSTRPSSMISKRGF